MNQKNKRQQERDINDIEIKGYGRRIREIRKSRKMTMEEFGSRIGVSAPTIASYENEQRSPRIETIGALAKEYGYSVDYIIGLSDIPNLQVDIKDAHDFFFKHDINWQGKPINPNDLGPFRTLLQQIMDMKTDHNKALMYGQNEADQNEADQSRPNETDPKDAIDDKHSTPDYLKD